MKNGTIKYPEKVLGILGGMGPAATAEFVNILIRQFPAHCDQEYPKIILFSNPQIPDRNKAILENGQDPTPYLKEGLLTLKKWGADFLAIPCNTAHYFIDSFISEIDIPLIHIVEATIKKAKNFSPKGAWVLSTLATKKIELYEKYAEKEDYNLFHPDWVFMEKVQKVIDMVKMGNIEESAKDLKPLLENLWKSKNVPIIAGCTELPIAYKATKLPKNLIISSLEALAEECIEEDLK